MHFSDYEILGGIATQFKSTVRKDNFRNKTKINKGFDSINFFINQKKCFVLENNDATILEHIIIYMSIFNLLLPYILRFSILLLVTSTVLYLFLMIYLYTDV